jgi:hypothetical protein
MLEKKTKEKKTNRHKNSFKNGMSYVSEKSKIDSFHSIV